MKSILYTAITIMSFLQLSSLKAEIITRTFHFDIAYQGESRNSEAIASLFYKEPDGSITYISSSEKALIKHLESLTADSVVITIDHDPNRRSIDFVKLDEHDWNALVPSTPFFGKIPPLKENSAEQGAAANP